MKKKLLALLLALTMVATLVPVSASANDEITIDNVYILSSWMPYAGMYVREFDELCERSDEWKFYDLFGYFEDIGNRFSNEVTWYEYDGTGIDSTLGSGDALSGETVFETGDYVMGVSVIPEAGYTTSGMTAYDIMFVQVNTEWGGIVPDTTMHDFVLKDGVFYTVVHVTGYDEIRQKAAISAGNMPETAARKLMAEDYLVDGSVKFSAMSEHQLSVYDREDFVHDETAEFLGIPSGIILSSGDASSALEGDYDDGGRMGSYNGYYYFDGDSSDGDTDLYEEFDEYPQYDTATLEFTVKAPDKSYPLSMTFNYAYASQEMDEGPEYNDVFALFVSQGKDSPDAESVFSNYATMKTDTQGSIGKVTVSNMKAAIKAADEAADGNGNFCVSENSGVKFVDGAYEYDGEFEFDILEEYGLLFNGLTDVYSTTVSGIEGGKYYTIKIAIADASDSMVDGAVFLQANSLYFGIEAPIVTGLSHYGVTKAVEQPEINLGVKQYGKVYIVPAGQPYTTEDALKNAASKVWRNDYKNGIVIDSGAFDLFPVMHIRKTCL